jgi:hypothetical protein
MGRSQSFIWGILIVRRFVAIAVSAVFVLMLLPSGCSVPGYPNAEGSPGEDVEKKRISQIPCQPDTWIVPGQLKLTSLSQVANGTSVNFANLHRAELTFRVRPIYVDRNDIEIRKGPPTWSKLSIGAGSSATVVFSPPVPYAHLKALMVDLGSSKD